jgi:2'-5' RNA ligase
MLRLFVAVTLPEKTLEACAKERGRVEAALGPLAKGVRFVRPEGLHFTLKFLGWTPEPTVPALVAGLEEVASRLPPFPLWLEGLEAFPSVRRPRVVFLEVGEGAEPMARLAALVEEALAPLGFPAEQRGFTPHVTLARIRDPRFAAAIGESVGALAPRPVSSFEVTRVSLIRSELSNTGSRYTELAGCELRG